MRKGVEAQLEAVSDAENQNDHHAMMMIMIMMQGKQSFKNTRTGFHILHLTDILLRFL